MRIAIALVALLPLVVAATGCGPRLVDCEALARDQAECMPAEAQDECAAVNTQCEEAGGSEVLVLESCPLQFACDVTSP